MIRLLTIFLLFSLQTFATNYYVSNSGSNSNNGTSAATPWQTFTKVNSFATFANGDSVLFKSGEIFTGWLIPNHNSLKFGVYGGTAKPTFSGLQTLTGFTNSGNIYSSTNTIIKDSVNVVVMDGYPLLKGRTPNDGSYYYYSSNTATSLKGGAMFGFNYVGADVIKIVNAYTVDKGRITAHADSTLTYQATRSLQPSGTSSLSAGPNFHGYFVQGQLSMLDQYGEWCYNPGTSVLSIYLNGAGVTGHTLQASFVDTLVNCGSRTGLSFSNIIFTGANQFALWASGGSADSVKNCEFYNNTNSIMVSNSPFFYAKNNIVRNSFQSGIVAQLRQSSNVYVGTNTVDSVGIFMGQGVNNYGGRQLKGIIVELDSTRATGISFVSENRVTNIGSTGIQFNGSNLRIDSNLVDGYCKRIQDGGGIYSFGKNNGLWGASASDKRMVNRIIDGNIVMNTDGVTNLEPGVRKPDVVGIYMDDQLENVIVRNNTAFNVRGNGIQLNSSKSISVYDNVFYNDSVGVLFNQKSGFTLDNVTFKNNVSYNLKTTHLHDWLLDRNTNITTATLLSNLTIDSNRYGTRALGFKTDQGTKVSGGIMTNSTTNLTSWKTKLSKETASTEKTGISYFVYNDSLTAKTKSLPTGAWVDIKTGIKYTGTITLQAMRSAVLLNTLDINAGSDVSITLPTNSVNISGIATGGSTPYTTYQWTKISGPVSYSFLTPNLYKTDVNNLTTGIYQFRVSVTDAAGGTAVDTVQVTVLQSANVPPVARAGNDTTITLPASTASLNAGLSTDDGAIVSYAWAKISGPSGGTIANANVSSTTVSALTQGTYVYSVTVTDNFGATNTDTKQIIVNPAIPPPNIAPVANAGSNSDITLPTSSVALNASASTDADGTITAYAWTKISGPASTITSATSAVTTATGLTAGNYVFRVKVTDNSGDTAVASKTVVVNPEPIPILTLSVSGTDATCNGGSTGSATATVTGGGGGTTYLWVPGNQTTSSIGGKAAGTYTVTATDVLGSSLTASVNISEPSAISANALFGIITSPSGTTTVIVTGNGGTGALSGTGTFTGVDTGFHFYDVSDINGCTTRVNIYIPVTATPITLNLTANNTNLCSGNQEGYITSIVGGGTGVYTYQWTILSGSVTPGLNDSSSTLNNLPAGTYQLDVFDELNQTATAIAVITEPQAITITTSYAAIDTAGGFTTVTVTAIGGTGTLTGTGVFTSVPAGTYTYTVTDANSCSTTKTITIADGAVRPQIKRYRFKKG